MIIENKDFTVECEIEDPIDYCINATKEVESFLDENYKGVCYSDCFILEILEVLNVTSCVIVKTNNKGNGIINITFKAKTIIYAMNDIINAFHVTKNANNIFGCADAKYNNGTSISGPVECPIDGFYDSIETGMIIPVIIKNIPYYETMNNTILVSTELLLPKRDCIIYKPIGEITDYTNIMKYVKILMNGYKDRNKINQINLHTFEKLIYGIKTKSDNKDTYGDWVGLKSTPVKRDGPEDDILVNIMDLFTKGKYTDSGMSFYRPFWINKTSSMVCKSKTTSIAPREMSAEMVFIIFLLEMINYNSFVINSSKIYTQELLDENKIVWKMMNNYKI